MINSLIIHFRRFDWMNAVSGKVLTSLKTALGQFEAIKFGQDLSLSETGPICPATRSVSSALEKFSVGPPINLKGIRRVQDGKRWLGCCIITRDEKERILFMSFVHAGVGYFQMTSA